MTRTFPAWSVTALGTVAILSLAAAPAVAQGSISSSGGPVASSGGSGGGSGGGTATATGGGSASSGGGSSAGPSSSGGGSSGGYSGGGGVASAPQSGGNGSGRTGATGGSGYVAPRTGENSRTSAVGRHGGGNAGRDPSGHTPVGSAVPRGSVPSGTRPGSVIFVPGAYYGGYYDPWWYGPGYIGMYAGYYDPWYGGYPSPQSTYTPYREEGALKLKIKPREAEVYVDGYFVGVVDDFDGLFQKLHIESGPHRIEVRAPGYETLVIEVRIAVGETTTYHGDLKRIQ